MIHFQTTPITSTSRANHTDIIQHILFYLETNLFASIKSGTVTVDATGNSPSSLAPILACTIQSQTQTCSVAKKVLQSIASIVFENMLTGIAVASLEVCMQKNAASTAACIRCSRPNPADLAEELRTLDSNSTCG